MVLDICGNPCRLLLTTGKYFPTVSKSREHSSTVWKTGKALFKI